MAIGHNSEDYKNSLINLAPQGIAWSKESTALWVNLLDALAQEYARIDANAVYLLDEIFPDTTTLLLPDWERVAGLPDECSQPGETIAIRRHNLLQKIASRGGQSKAYFISTALSLGYTVTVDEFTPFRVGISSVGDPLCNEQWWFTWRINAPENTIVWFRAHEAGAHEPLAFWGNERLECNLNKLKPAHTVLLFGYA